MTGREAVCRQGCQSRCPGLLTKGISTAELHAAVRNVTIGKRFLLEDGIEALVTRLASHNSGVELVDGLSDRELQILCLIARGRKPKQIAHDIDLTKKTVDTYRSRLQRKLGLVNTAKICRFAFENALLDP